MRVTFDVMTSHKNDLVCNSDKWDHSEFLPTGKSDLQCQIKEMLIVQ